MQGPRLVIGDVSGVAECQDTLPAQRPRDDGGVGSTRAFAVCVLYTGSILDSNYFGFWETDGVCAAAGGFRDGWLAAWGTQCRDRQNRQKLLCQRRWRKA